MNSWLCEDCLAKIPYLPALVCLRCGAPVTGNGNFCRQCENNPLQAVDGIRAAASFKDNPLRPAIHALKYGNHKAVAPLLGQMLVEAYQRYQLAADVIAPVPLHASRMRERGYNQSELLARVAASLLNLPLNTTSLQRLRKTKAQMSLGADERYQNVVDAFSCNRDLSGASVLLIDDVCTTGSMLDACAVALKEQGVAAVWGLTLARAN